VRISWLTLATNSDFHLPFGNVLSDGLKKLYPALRIEERAVHPAMPAQRAVGDDDVLFKGGYRLVRRLFGDGFPGFPAVLLYKKFEEGSSKEILSSHAEAGAVRFVRVEDGSVGKRGGDHQRHILGQRTEALFALPERVEGLFELCYVDAAPDDADDTPFDVAERVLDDPVPLSDAVVSPGDPLLRQNRFPGGQHLIVFGLRNDGVVSADDVEHRLPRELILRNSLEVGVRLIHNRVQPLLVLQIEVQRHRVEDLLLDVQLLLDLSLQGFSFRDIFHVAVDVEHLPLRRKDHPVVKLDVDQRAVAPAKDGIPGGPQVRVLHEILQNRFPGLGGRVMRYLDGCSVDDLHELLRGLIPQDERLARVRRDIFTVHGNLEDPYGSVLEEVAEVALLRLRLKVTSLHSGDIAGDFKGRNHVTARTEDGNSPGQKVFFSIFGVELSFDDLSRRHGLADGTVRADGGKCVMKAETLPPHDFRTSESESGFHRSGYPEVAHPWIDQRDDISEGVEERLQGTYPFDQFAERVRPLNVQSSTPPFPAS
jgi:hypothetical protein